MSCLYAILFGLVFGCIGGIAHEAIKAALRRRKVRRDWTSID